MNAPALGVLEALSLLLRYPGPHYREQIARCTAALKDRDTEAALHVGRFVNKISGMTVERLQELFTQSFDLSPLCSLEVGWHLYGEEYARGNFLVAMRGLLRDHGIEESTELPDHLTHLLPLLDRLSGDERDDFVERFLTPALTKMLRAFEGKDSPWVEVLRAVECAAANTTQVKAEEAVHG